MEIPADAITALREYDRADDEWLRLALDLLAGKATSREALQEAGAVRDQALAELWDLPWWGTVDPLVAYMELRRAARSDVGPPGVG
jgi:hypothetical protein